MKVNPAGRKNGSTFPREDLTATNVRTRQPNSTTAQLAAGSEGIQLPRNTIIMGQVSIPKQR